MDEILASIRRIITDDDAPEGEADATQAADAEPPSTAAAKGKGEEGSRSGAADAPAGSSSKAEPNKSEPSKKATDEAVTVSEKDMPDTKVGEGATPDASLVDEKVATDTASAFAKLSVAVKESSGEPSMSMPAPGRSLEDVVRELLRPILKEWLETHLPEIVREHVEEEVSRISRGSRSR
ncbi:MAG TPA: DUF2497 domain-containing protein [Caulobacteraceae bacterium]